jgi:NAD(P)-dependent dehydrogenase (short-subunit alcohol dehydrogenase family)
VVIADLPSSAGASVAASIGAVFSPTDVTSEADVLAALDMVEKFGGAPVNAVVNCAGVRACVRAFRACACVRPSVRASVRPCVSCVRASLLLHCSSETACFNLSIYCRSLAHGISLPLAPQVAIAVRTYHPKKGAHPLDQFERVMRINTMG